MSRRRWIQLDGKLVEVTNDYTQDVPGVLIMADIPGYTSPVTGLWVEGRRARREDLKRTGSRPYEGLESEQREVERFHKYEEQKLDRQLTQSVSEAYYALPASKRDALKRAQS